MPGIIGQGVTLRGLRSEDFTYTFNLTGTGGNPIPVGSPMMLDAAADNSAKAVTDGATLIGALMSFENRISEGIIVGAIARKGNFVFDYTGTAPTRGQGVVGSATANKVKSAGAAIVNNMVVEVDTTKQQVMVIFD